VLDFGLASAPIVELNSNPENSPTLSLAAATQAGVILGTAAYMSPEQASGKALDKRTDIWSFGVVLWELITGERLFQGETTSDTLASVLRDPVDVGKLPIGTPSAIRELLQRCLDRDSRTRLRDIGEARIVLERKPSLAPEHKPSRVRTLWLWTAAAAVALAAIIGWLRPRGESHDSVALSIVPPNGLTLVTVPVISPDGKSVWYQTTDLRMYVRPIDSVDAHLIPGSAPRPAFWSPDSSAVFHWDAWRRVMLKLSNRLA
jgi:serine/threonine protein kinase